MPKVSIIVPVYNAEKYLKRCLDSLVNQTLRDIDIILINDGSTDNSDAICREYMDKDSRISLLSQENAGLSVARNSGIEAARGEFIGFVDADDWVDTDYFEKLYDAAVRNDCDIAFGDIVRKNEKKHKIRLNIEKEEVSEDIYDKIKNARFVHHPGVWNKIYKKSLFDDGLRFEYGKYYEDGLFTITVLEKCNKIVSVPNTYYYYFINPTSIVKTRPSLKKIHDKITTRANILNFATAHGIRLDEKSLLAAVYKMGILGLTLWVRKDSQTEKRYYLFGSILVFKCKK